MAILEETFEEPKGEVTNGVLVEPQEEKRKYSVVVDGEQKEVEYSDSELKKIIEENTGSKQRFEEAANIRKQAQEIASRAEEVAKLHGAAKELASKDLKSYLANLGIDFGQVAAEYMAQRFQLETMDPKDRELHQTRTELERERSTRLQYEQEKQSQTQKQEEERLYGDIRREIFDVISKFNLPKASFESVRLALLEDEQNHQKDKYADRMTDAQIAKRAKEISTGYARDYVGHYDNDDLIDTLGPDIVNKIIKAHMAKKAKGNDKTIVKPEKHEKEEKKRIMTPDEFEKEIFKRVGLTA